MKKTTSKEAWLAGLLIAGLSLSAISAHAASPIHHWKLDGDATDSGTDGGHDGTLEGDATFTTDSGGRVGEAVSLDGDGDFISTAQASLPATDFTLAAWIYRESTGDRMYVAGTQDSARQGAFLRVDFDIADGQAFFNLLPPADPARAWGGSVPLNTWTHLAATVSSTAGLTVYVDGSAVATDPTGTEHMPFDNFTIGARPDGGTSGFDGLIDDVRIYGSVLSESEIEAVIQPIEITALVLSEDQTSAEITWRSLSGQLYTVDRSTDLIKWDELTDGARGEEGETTSYVDSIPEGSTRIYYRVSVGEAE